MNKRQNNYIALVDNGIGVILTKGFIAEIDAVDFDLISGVKWYVTPGRNCMYAKTHRSMINVGLSHHTMHGLINQTTKGLVTDHIDGNGMNNRRSNLRTATTAQNQMSSLPKGKSGFKGVSIIRGRYQAKIWLDGKHKNLGFYATAPEAALAYDLAAVQHFGKFAKTNGAIHGK